MCGIAGILSKRRTERRHIEGMVGKIRHRGPDSFGYESLFEGRCLLGHARLSILDLSESGYQPMSYADGRYVMTYNGEVYNYLELREELKKEGFTFCTETDTEVVLAAYVHWGPKCVQHFNGMFAFLIVDTGTGRYFAARDRFGVKPLYYWWMPDGETLAVASEIKEFTELPGWKPQVNPQMAYDYLNFGLTDHTSETMFQDVWQLRGGECMGGVMSDPVGSLRVRRWYDRSRKTITISREEAVEQFKELFFDAVKLRLRSDVKVGSCLSGGLDSSAIVCAVNDLLKGKADGLAGGSGAAGDDDLAGADGLASATVDGRQQTVSARALDTPHDESEYIDIVLKERGLEGFFVDPSPEKLWEIMKDLIWQQDEPFGSTSIFAQWCVFGKAREKDLTVMLDGQGADELLAGYHRFFDPYYAKMVRSLRWKELAGEVRQAGKYHGYSWKTVLKGVAKTSLPDSVLRKMGAASVSSVPWISVGKLGAVEQLPAYYGSDRAKTLGELSDHLFFHNNMPMLLRYEDRNSMTHSVESRLPFLDYRLVEFARSLPDDFKIHDGETKWILRESMKDVLPEKIRTRMDKIGFETPEEKWEREHREEFRAMVADAVEKTDGIIDPSALDYFDRAVEAGKPDFSVWRMINFGVWYDTFIN